MLHLLKALYVRATPRLAAVHFPPATKSTPMPRGAGTPEHRHGPDRPYLIGIVHLAQPLRYGQRACRASTFQAELTGFGPSIAWSKSPRKGIPKSRVDSLGARKTLLRSKRDYCSPCLEDKPKSPSPLTSTPLVAGEVTKRCAGFDRVALVILTDGHENASREFTRDDILKLLTRKQEQDGWLVIYLGANQDAWEVGQKFGSASPNTMSFDAMNASVVMASAADATNRYVASRNEQLGRREAGFSKEERERARALTQKK